MKRPTVPCKDCADRRLKCHADCEKYAEFITGMEEWKNAIKAGKRAAGVEVWEEGE